MKSQTERVSEVRNVLAARARLGEGPVWDEATRVLSWVDILNHRVHRFVPKTGDHRIYEVGDVVSCAVPAGRETMLLALRHGLARLNLGSGRVERLLTVEHDNPAGRLNDGKCDSRGRFWIGSMSSEGSDAGRLYRYDPDGSLHTMETGLGIANGLGWSPDDGAFYLTDSPARTIFAYDFDAAAGAITHRRVFAELSGEDFFPDGLAVDAEGCIWSAQWAGSCIVRFAPDGRELRRVEMPVKLPTSCAFGGSDLTELYVTSASVGLSQQEIEENFFSGDLFCVQTGVRGLPTHRFGGASSLSA